MSWQDRIVEFGRKPANQFAAHPQNARRHPNRQREALRGSLETIGNIGVIIENKQSGYVIDGHARIEEALTADENQELAYVLVDLEPHEEAQALASYDFITYLAEYERDNLDSLLRDIQTDDERVMATLSELAEEHDLYFGDAPEIPDAPDPQIDRAEELNQKWQVQSGDLWVIPSETGDGEHRLLCGDSTSADDVARLMDGDKWQLMVTSPPYNQKIDSFTPSGMQKENPAFVERMMNSYFDSLPENEYQQQQIGLIELLVEFASDNASIFYNHKIRYRDKAIISPFQWLCQLSIPIRQKIIWSRGSSITQNARMFIPSDERIYWLRVGDDFIFNDTTDIKTWSSVWRFGAHNEISISAAFANELPKRCIMACSHGGNIIIDVYGGSGTTMAVSEQLSRQCRMIEIHPPYCAVVLQRMEDMGLTPIRVSDDA